jgi:hypothetical protein
VSSNTRSLTSDTLHCASIPKEAECVIINKIEAWLIEFRSGFRLRYGKTHSVCEALTKGTGSNLDAWDFIGFRMTWG